MPSTSTPLLFRWRCIGSMALSVRLNTVLSTEADRRDTLGDGSSRSGWTRTPIELDRLIPRQREGEGPPGQARIANAARLRGLLGVFACRVRRFEIEWREPSSAPRRPPDQGPKLPELLLRGARPARFGRPMPPNFDAYRDHGNPSRIRDDRLGAAAFGPRRLGISANRSTRARGRRRPRIFSPLLRQPHETSSKGARDEGC